MADKILNNIYTIAERKSIAVKDIEKAADLSVGYLSRLKRENSGDKLSIRNLLAISRALGTELDTLVYCDVAGLTDEGLLVVDFINNLTKRTETGSLGWRRLGLPIGYEVNQMEALMSKKLLPQHPLLRFELKGLVTGLSPQKAYYHSLFYSDFETDRVTGVEAVSASLGEGKGEVFVVKVYYPTELAGQNYVLESYIYINDVINPIKKEYIKSQGAKGELERLYDTILGLQNKPRLQKTVKETLQAFLNNGE